MDKNSKKNNTESFPKVGINWYPGHMAKTKKQIKESLNLIDIVYEVIDARIPYSSKIQDIKSLIKDKPRVLIMTKYDLCDKVETNKFVTYYKKLGYSVLTYDLINDTNIKELFILSKNLLLDKLTKETDKGINRTNIRALVIGVPNVGKSTLINKIIGKKSTNVGNMPGITKEVRWLRGKEGIELMDSPGILWPKLEQSKIALNLASTTAIKEEILEKQDVALYIINVLFKYYPEQLKNMYGITTNLNPIEIFDIIGKKKGYLLRGGIVDYNKVVDSILNDIKSGKIKNITFDRIEDVK